jgi:hypothetical protein
MSYQYKSKNGNTINITDMGHFLDMEVIHERGAIISTKVNKEEFIKIIEEMERKYVVSRTYDGVIITLTRNDYYETIFMYFTDTRRNITINIEMSMEDFHRAVDSIYSSNDYVWLRT